MRTTAIDNLVKHFLSSPSSFPRKQIISLGAGSDTRFFRLRSQNPPCSPFTYHELDFPSNTAQKISTITRHPGLRSLISGEIAISEDLASLSSPCYTIIPFDLRILSTASASTIPQAISHIDTSLPALLISECCLIYLTPADADSTISFFAQRLFPPTTPLALILYEPINPHTPFGQVMVSNLAARGIVLQTLKKYGTLEAQKERLRVYGFTEGQRVQTVDELWEGVSEREKERVGRLEMVDEVEEWRLLAGHYCVSCGWRDGGGGDIWRGWREEGKG